MARHMCEQFLLEAIVPQTQAPANRLVRTPFHSLASGLQCFPQASSARQAVLRDSILAQRVQETLAVGVILEDRFSAVTMVHHMVHRARILDSQLARHSSEIVDGTTEFSILLTDPFVFGVGQG
jgi:hypothetical protein